MVPNHPLYAQLKTDILQLAKNFLISPDSGKPAEDFFGAATHHPPPPPNLDIARLSGFSCAT